MPPRGAIGGLLRLLTRPTDVVPSVPTINNADNHARHVRSDQLTPFL
jgi:hypothetical protein